MSQKFLLGKVLCLVFVVFSCMTGWQSGAMAQAIQVTQGETVTLMLRLVNVGDFGIQKAHVRLYARDVPNWIKPEFSPSQFVDIPAKSAANPRPSAMLPLIFTVDWDAPVDAEVSIPLQIHSGYGDVWTKIVQLRVIPQLKPAPRESQLFQNYPNPFNPETWIPYQLEKSANVKIQIFNASGQIVRTLDLGLREAGFYLTRDKAAYWDGANDLGERVASGVYFYKLQSDRFSDMRKLIVVK